MVIESARGSSVARIYKFRDPDGVIERLARSGVPAEALAVKFSDRLVEVKEVKGNVFLDEGINYIWKLAKGESGLTPFGSNSCIGVGDGTTPADPSQKGLLGTNRYYKTVDSGYPVVQGTQMIFQATFGGSEGVFTWNEWTIANGCDDSYINVNRKVASLGTKANGYTWVFRVWLTIT
jgi:hypothetical protein